jgi:hypothetical protein
MSFLVYNDKSSSLKLDDSNLTLEEKILIEKLWALFEKHGHDLDSASTGVFPSPDFGYFDLAGRYWRAAICIYFAGFCKGFIEAGAGFLEPWLFNSRHAIELYLKGCQMYVIWYQEIHKDFLKSGYKKLIEKIQNSHNLVDLYKEYKEKLENALSSWNADEICDPPEMDKLTLTKRGEELLIEISEADPNSFRFRYPSLIHRQGEKEKVHKIQEMLWEWDERKLFPLTGLPKSAGVAFTHAKVMNSIHDLMKELDSISSYHDALHSYLGEIQGIGFELHSEFYSDMAGNYY